jgi:hypothetical protein
MAAIRTRIAKSVPIFPSMPVRIDWRYRTDHKLRDGSLALLFSHGDRYSPLSSLRLFWGWWLSLWKLPSSHSPTPPSPWWMVTVQPSSRKDAGRRRTRGSVAPQPAVSSVDDQPAGHCRRSRDLVRLSAHCSRNTIGENGADRRERAGRGSDHFGYGAGR